ncbi:hypothetical protein CANTEDRAFT_124781 [Yamadazyma tenuis ATCC 10573]|uniref:General substrate transporter n=1 Tax=Candida tenuis (strain ATCC 10573 / BCRC 21748 / CBS 615 / JCM 9827 / NBRC 10315 / NRRL Y-1498 / VKM Y-70) TaxID=590646 RepID=G3B8B4_CANTC|nr:general substrate transporter [Yamadazyma tenuis ATCC 10573]XP_006689124.1 uncharacterized protein CANTEDRAFT_124781 [Yamadazyma tenuis ATCC 10573]EGV62953.1 general substrate transporter [Yamadazyma tenuis ATCC 10573]EGV62954.1 hypothetical protein CANTEDRAFT_124781 [Yamadazyma tenuis ATCC 10573]
MKYFEIWKPGKQVSIAVAFTCELSFILFGIEQGIAGIIITGEDFLNQFGNPTGSWLGFIVSIYTLGCFFGCIVNFFTGDMLGRRKTIAVAMCLIMVGVTLQCTSFSVAQLMVGRFITGLGTGMETSSVPMYQAELAKPHLRGRLVCSEALFVGIGLVFAYFLDFGFSYIKTPVAWRVPLSIQIPFAFIVLLMTFTVPESPRYLYFKGKKEEAKRILSYVFDKPEDHPDIVKNYQEIEEAISLETQDSDSSWKAIFVADHARTRYRIFLAYMSMFAQQLGGVNIINYYITTILIESVGLEHTLAMILGGVAVICFTVGSIIPSFFADKLGRRMPLVYGYAGCFICFLMVTILLNFQSNADLKASTGAAAVAFFFLYQLCFGASGNCIPWVYVPELIPLKYRAKGTAIGISSNWLWNFFLVEISPELISAGTRSHKQGLSYLPFVFTNFIFIFQFYFFYPETKNLTLEKIDELFSENRTIFMGLVDQRRFREGILSTAQSDIEKGTTPQSDIEKGTSEHIEIESSD